MAAEESSINLSCSIAGCNKQLVARTLCQYHYDAAKYHGVLTLYPYSKRKGQNQKLSIAESLELFWKKVDRSEACWTWTAKLDYKGYGVFWFQGKHYKAHRFAYELIGEVIPKGLELDHLCRNRACVNPEHLEPVTHKENMARGAHAKKTHCPRGHEYNESNTHINRKGSRTCRSCRRIRNGRGLVVA